LLTGLKTAFLTSIAGMTASLILKTFPFMYGYRQKEDGAGNHDSERMIDLLGRIERAICGDGDTTMITQLKSLRTDTRDGFANLSSLFKEFADRVVADSTESLIAALEAVIHDFNTAITEQFGDNFRQLNDAVGKLLVWQEQYKEWINTMTDKIDVMLTNISTYEQRVNTVLQDAERFTAVAENLQTLLNNLNTNLYSINRMAEKIPDVLPEIGNAVNKLTQDFSEQVRQAGDTVKSTTDRLGSFTQNLLRDSEESVRNQLAVMDKQLGDQLTQIFQKFGENLLGITKRFANGYGELADRLENLHAILIRNNNL
jgi:DNA anti-recombination protein RmuC